MKRISIFVGLMLVIMGFGVNWIGSVNAAEPTLSKAVFYVG